MDIPDTTPIAVAISMAGKCIHALTYPTIAQAQAFRDGFNHGTSHPWGDETVRAHVFPFRANEFPDDGDHSRRNACIQACQRALALHDTQEQTYLDHLEEDMRQLTARAQSVRTWQARLTGEDATRHAPHVVTADRVATLARVAHNAAREESFRPDAPDFTDCSCGHRLDEHYWGCGQCLTPRSIAECECQRFDGKPKPVGLDDTSSCKDT